MIGVRRTFRYRLHAASGKDVQWLKGRRPSLAVEATRADDDGPREA